MGRQRSTARESTLTLEELYREHIALSQAAGRFQTNPDTFASRVYIGTHYFQGRHQQIWRIPEVEDPQNIEDMIARDLYNVDSLYRRNFLMGLQLDTQLGLPPAFASSPTRPPRFGFYFHKGRDFHSFHNFYSLYAAARFVNAVIDGQPFKWSADNEIEIHTSDITIRAEHFTDLEKVIEHKDNAKEAQWVLPSPYTHYVRSIIRGTQHYTPSALEPNEEVAPKQPIQPKEVKPKREKRSQARPALPEGVTTVGDIANALSIEPRAARQALRRSNTPKPALGWCWTSPEDVKAITKIIKENLK